MEKINNVLIIDDDVDDVELFVEAINEISPLISCSSALNGEEGLNKLKDIPFLPDMIFLDLNMPGISGKECLAEIKNTNTLSHIPVVIYSTSSYQKDIDETLELGASVFLTKPSTYTDTCRELSKILLKRTG